MLLGQEMLDPILGWHWEGKETYHFVLMYCLLLIYVLHCSMFYNVFSRNVKNNSCRQLSSLSTKLMRWFRHRMELVTECQLFIFGFRVKEMRQKVGKHFFSYNKFQMVSFFPPSLHPFFPTEKFRWFTETLKIPFHSIICKSLRQVPA